MNDYKELIERLKCPYDISECKLLKLIGSSCAECWRGPMKEAAEAIETLLAELETVAEYFHGDCDKCVYAKLDPNENPCAGCSVIEYNPPGSCAVGNGEDLEKAENERNL